MDIADDVSVSVKQSSEKGTRERKKERLRATGLRERSLRS